MGNRIYGCDDCLAVCPWNKFAETAREAKFKARHELDAVPLERLAALDDVAFREMFSGSPVKRTGRDRFVRNVMIAIGNSEDQALLPAVEARLDDEAPLVRAMAVWAYGRLAHPSAFARAKAARLCGETDQGVCREWEHDVTPGLEADRADP